MSDVDEFDRECRINAEAMANDKRLREETMAWIVETSKHRYTYNFRWMGLPVIQFPQDLMALQEIIWNVRPDLIIETGIARGGSVVFYASLLEAMGNGRVLGIDIDIRPHNRAAIESHPMAKRIDLLEASSVEAATIAKVREIAVGKQRIVVVLDSNHTHEHALKELEAYAPLVSPGSYIAVLDTIIENMPEASFPDRPWGRGNNPKTAVHEFLRTHPEFEIDRELENKLLLTVAPDGYLKRKS